VIELVVRSIIPAALSMLPPAMDSSNARAMLVATGLQESKFLERRQIVKGGKKGPAAGLWQFEQGGAVRGVLEHKRTREHALAILRELRYHKAGRVITSSAIVHAKIEDNDVLACVFARLLLWTLPGRLPTRNERDLGWAQYLNAWRPGRPHPDTWGAYFDEAWQRVDQEEEREP